MSEENTMRLLQEPSPHVRRKDSATRMMLDVLLALLPLLIFSFIVYRLDALKVFGIAVPAMMIAEWVFVMIKGRMPYDGEKHPFKEKFLHALKLYRPVNAVAPAVSALIFGMCLPPTTSWWGVLVGALAGIIFGKLLSLGQLNILVLIFFAVSRWIFGSHIQNLPVFGIFQIFSHCFSPVKLHSAQILIYIC